jgi:prevent-host-death family protein
MKAISVKDARSDIEAVLDAAQRERVVVTRAGKPSAVIIGIEGYDEEDLQLASSPEFRRMIEERRRGPTIPLSELKDRLKEKKRSRQPAEGTKRNQKKRNSSSSSKR